MYGFADARASDNRALDTEERMKGEELKAMQAPFKARYREAPETAVVTLKAAGEIGESTLTCSH